MSDTHTTEVAIIGAGILGLVNALQYAKRGFKVALVDNIVGQKRSYKVGESLLVFSNPFLRAIGGLDDFIQNSFPKDGVWFTYGMEGKETFEGVTEWAYQAKLPQRWMDAMANKKLFRAMFYDAQIVRPDAEDLLRENCRSHPNIRFLDTAKVKDIALAEDDTSSHVIAWECGITGQKWTLLARWILDCSGRARLLAKTLKHASEEREMNDGFQTTAVWAQLDGIEDELFGEPWAYDFKDGGRTLRDHNTCHLWGDGYWIWVIRLSDKRISIGATFDQRKAPPGKNGKEQFWNIINRYPLLKRALSEKQVLEFRQYKNVQYMTDTFVSHRRYGMVGDAASIIDAYYSQGVSLGLVTSWHIANIVEGDLCGGSLDRKYVDRVNEATRQDWHMMRNMVSEKYTTAIKDPRFFVLSHLLDLSIFSAIIVQRYQLVRWLVETDSNTANETKFHKEARARLAKTLYYSQTTPWSFLKPETVQRMQRHLQEGLGERARWRLENGVELAGIKAIVRVNASMPNVFKTVLGKAKEMLDISPAAVNEPAFMRITGKEEAPLAMRFGGPVMLSLFLSMYAYDWAETSARKIAKRVSTKPEVAPPMSEIKATRMPDMTLKDETGASVRLSDYWRKQPTAFVFIRHFGCPHCRVELTRLQRDIAQIKAAGGRVVAVCMAKSAKAAQFKKSLGFEFPILSDNREELYDGVGLLQQENGFRENAQSFVSDAPLAVKMLLKGTYGPLMMGGNDLRLGGTIVTDRTGKLIYEYRAKMSSGAAPFGEVLNALRQAAAAEKNEEALSTSVAA